jgi:hypothetical protein
MSDWDEPYEALENVVKRVRVAQRAMLTTLGTDSDRREIVDSELHRMRWQMDRAAAAMWAEVDVEQVDRKTRERYRRVAA